MAEFQRCSLLVSKVSLPIGDLYEAVTLIHSRSVISSKMWAFMQLRQVHGNSCGFRE